LIFRHADGSSYGSIADAGAAETYARAFVPCVASDFASEKRAPRSSACELGPTWVNRIFQGVMREALAVLTGQVCVRIGGRTAEARGAANRPRIW